MSEPMDPGCLSGRLGQHEFRWAESNSATRSGLYYCIHCLFELTPNEALTWRGREVGTGRRPGGGTA